MKFKLLLLIIPLLLFSWFIIFPRPTAEDKKESQKVIKVGKMEIKVEVAETEAARAKGLSGRTSLPQDQGMLFVFNGKSRYSFWMKEMNFPLDFVWIDDQTVVDLTKDVPSPKDNESPAVVIPKAPVDKVLEVNAGVVEKSGVKIGDQVEGL